MRPNRSAMAARGSRRRPRLRRCPAAAPAACRRRPSTDEIDRWINDLGDDSYTVRQAAAERLTAGGFAARAALDEVADGPDPEIRSAARRLVTLIDNRNSTADWPSSRPTSTAGAV